MTLRLLADQNVDEKYTETFLRTDRITTTRVRDALHPEATDGEIATFAEDHDWIVFAGDKGDFENIDPDCGVVIYHQTENPSPGTVVEALRRIEGSFATTTTSTHTCPTVGSDRSIRNRTRRGPR